MSITHILYKPVLAVVLLAALVPVTSQAAPQLEETLQFGNFGAVHIYRSTLCTLNFCARRLAITGLGDRIVWQQLGAREIACNRASAWPGQRS
jgi:hypothetical protein